MKKIITIICAVLAIILLIFLIYIAFFAKKPQPGADLSTSINIKPLPSPTIPAGDTVNIVTAQGSLTVNNFYKKAEKIIETAVYLKNSPNYAIIYGSDSNQFLISLYATDASQANLYRSQAESEFINILGISKADACKLNMDVEVANSYDQALSNTNYGLSFCPNSVTLP